MPKENNPIFRKLQERSKSFCPAKWNELYLYLNHGNSNSCHHPIPHKIPKKEIENNPFRLHNTPHKLKMQEMMMQGQRPKECNMCWHIEENNPDAVSDRIVKGEVWENDIDKLELNPYHVPKMIEVVFDNLCNLGCSYCDSGQSSTWASRIKNNPLTLKTDYRNLYNTIHIENAKSIDTYLNAWLNWWPEISQEVEILKISGGEPLISPSFWNFFEVLDNSEASHLDFRINSNMSIKSDYVDKFIEKTKQFKTVTISASIDAVGDIAEYARAGLDYNLFLKNIKKWCEESDNNGHLVLQSTVNILNIWGLKEKLKLVLELRSKYGNNKIHCMYSTIVRFPEFQSIYLLPDYLRKDISEDLQFFINSNEDCFFERELHYVRKIISCLENPSLSMFNLDENNLFSDLQTFLDYYDQHSSKKHTDIFPEKFVNWINSNKNK